MAKKLGVKITYGCGKVSIIKCTSRKQAESECKLRCGDGNKIWNGKEYTSDYKIKRVAI
jgi:hypothetical protein